MTAAQQINEASLKESLVTDVDLVTGKPGGFYLSPAKKLVLSAGLASLWMLGSLFLAIPWIRDLSEIVGPVLAVLIVCGVALFPGFSLAFTNASLILDKRPLFRMPGYLPPVSILVAAYNEEKHIQATLESICRQKFPGTVEVIVINDGSKDNTAAEVQCFMEKYTGPFSIRLENMPRNGGKANALNHGLQASSHDIVVTIDADTYLYRDALASLCTNLVNGPANTAAVAGTMLVKNSRANLMTRMQEWDYFLGISINKRTQSLYQGTLVAQGAFSAYYKKVIEEVGGWSNTVGEDIVLTWGFRDHDYRVGYAENAFAFTNVPSTYKAFFKQRLRWSRGLMEGFFTFPKVITDIRMNSPFIWLNLLFPFTDFVFCFVFLPGIIAALVFQNYAIVGLMTLTLIPLALISGMLMYLKQQFIFHKYGLKVRRNLTGMIFYMFFYQVIMAPACLAGYWSEFINLKKRW